jgi:hypothetical protein
MSVYKLIVNQSVLQTVAAIQNIDTAAAPGQVNPHCRPMYPVGSTNPPAYQTWQLVISTPQPGVSIAGAAQPCGSNDGINWVAIGSPISISSTPNSATAGVTTNATYERYGAYLSTAVTGVGGLANLTMSA